MNVDHQSNSSRTPDGDTRGLPSALHRCQQPLLARPRSFGSGVDVGACGEVLPRFDGVEFGCVESAVGVEGIVAQ